MSGRISTVKSTGSCLDSTEKLKKTLYEADTVLVGAGAGLRVPEEGTFRMRVPSELIPKCPYDGSGMP